MMTEVFLLAAIFFALLIIGCIIRMLTAKKTADKMLALDVINVLVVIAMILLSLAFAQPVFIDVAVIYATVSFVGTMYVAKYVAGNLK